MLDYRGLVYQNYKADRIRRVKTLSSSVNNPSHRNYINKIKAAGFDEKAIILEIGAGRGEFLMSLRAAGFESFTGIDASPDSLRFDLGDFSKNVIEGDNLEYLKSLKAHSIDVVCALDVLEHYRKDELFELIFEVHRVLSPGGIILSHQPNGEGLFGMAVRYGDITHELCFTHYSIKQVFLACGFQEVQSFEDVPLLFSWKSIIRRFLWKFLVRPFYVALLVIECGGVDKDIILSKNFYTIAKK